VVPIILLLFLSAIELTRMNFLRHTAANAAYEATRTGTIPGNSVADCQSTATRILTAAGASQGATVDVLTSVDAIEVTVRIPVEQNCWGIARFTHGMFVNQSCKLKREFQ
jgi:hypothetical protein